MECDLQLKFYAYPQSPYCEGVFLVLEEMNLSYEYCEVNLINGEQKTSPYLAINPFGRIPAIVSDDITLSESRAIMRYLARKHKETQLYPEKLELAAQVDRLLDFSVVQVGQPISVVCWHQYFCKKLEIPCDLYLCDEAHKKVVKELDVLESYLEGKRYLVGVTPTIADLGFLPFVSQLIYTNISIAKYPNLERWFEQMSDRDSFRKMIAMNRL